MKWSDSTIELKELEVGFLVYDKKTSNIVRIREIIDSNTVLLETITEPREIADLKPALMTASRLSCFGFGKFFDTYDETLYHEPTGDALYSEEDFYGEIHLPVSVCNDKEEGEPGHILLYNRKGEKVIDENINFLHQIQKRLRDLGCKHLSYGEGFQSTLGSVKILKPILK